MKLKLAVVTLWGEDVIQMSDFYQNVLGLPLLNVDRGRPHFNVGEAYLVILSGKPHTIQDPGDSRFPVLAFAANNLHDVVHQLAAHGVEMPWGIEEDSDSRWVMFYDPGGNLIEIARMGINKHHE